MRKTQKSIKLSTLYLKLLQGNLSIDERLLIAQILKVIGTKKDVSVPYLAFTEKLICDIDLKEPKENFT